MLKEARMTCQTNCRTAFCSDAFPPFLTAPTIASPPAIASTEPRLPRELDGRCGWNRASGSGCHPAQNDLDALRAWLTLYSSNPSTLASYRREAERLLFWALLDRKKPLSSLSYDDLVGYPAFLADPQPREQWVTAHGVRLGRERSGWRPFAGPLSPNSVRQSLAVINRMFSWLVDAGYLQHNPLRPSKDAPHPSPARAVPRVDDDFLPIVTAALDALPCTTPRESEHMERARWLFALLYYGGLRISEASRSTMGAFYVRPLGVSKDLGEWWLALDGARRAARITPASRDLMRALIRYRLAHGLPPLPGKSELTPLILPIGGRDKHLKPRALHGIVKMLFLAASRLAGENGGDEAERLRSGSPNWLRHLSETTNSADTVAVSCDEVNALISANTNF